MKPISDIIKRPLIAAALATDDRSEQKQRLMTLWEMGFISAKEAEKLIRVMGLKHD